MDYVSFNCLMKQIMFHFFIWYVDIDECSGFDMCAELAYCENTNGSFRCICDEGYVGNGVTCEGNYDPILCIIITRS